MKIRSKFGSELFVADGNGVAFTVCLGKDGVATMSLASCCNIENGDQINHFWIDEKVLRSGDQLIIDMVEDVAATPPLFTTVEKLKDKIAAKIEYCKKTLAENPPNHAFVLPQPKHDSKK